jgi:hypothetical protein
LSVNGARGKLGCRARFRARTFAICGARAGRRGTHSTWRPPVRMATRYGLERGVSCCDAQRPGV